jgi:hypothetical protein
MTVESKTCPHCGAKLCKWTPPDDSTWGIQLVCFNDKCRYYVRGWKWMQDHYQQRASYRYRYNPENGAEGPLPVWSDRALREGIVENEEAR